VLVDQLNDARIRLIANSGIFTDSYDSTWDAISVLYCNQDQLEGHLAAGVDQLISQRIVVRLSDLATTLEHEIRTKVDSALAPIRVDLAILLRELE
jgi:hypothetical protein